MKTPRNPATRMMKMPPMWKAWETVSGVLMAESGMVLLFDDMFKFI